MEKTSNREKFGSRFGFILISAGCAIGLGNVWRFPYIVGKFGGGAFILLYLIFLVALGLPIMTMEFSVGRASQKSISRSFETLEPKGTKWHAYGWVGTIGNYLLMMFYTVITGWMFAYFFKTLRGDFISQSAGQISAQLGAFKGDVWAQIGCTALVVVLGILICSLGLKNGVEKVTKIMMVMLLAIIIVLAIYVVTLDGAGEGLKYYLIPDFGKMFTENNFGEVVMAAMSQAFFTLSIGMGSMAIFGSYLKKDRKLFGEAALISGLDTGVAFFAGLIIIPACAAYGMGYETAGPTLIFEVLPNIFANMPGGRIWGAVFFLFMIFAAMSTVIGVFENIISASTDKFGWSRKKSCIINLVILLVIAIFCSFGTNILRGFHPFGVFGDISDLADFLVSSNILPIGSLIYVLFCTWERKGWGFDNFLKEANEGKGLSFPKWSRLYVKYAVPVLILVVWTWGIIEKFII